MSPANSTHSCQVFVLGGIRQLELLSFFPRHSSQHAIEDVVVPLISSLGHNTRLLQKVLLNGGTLNHSILGEVDVDVLAEARRVVIPNGFGISKC